MRFTPIAQSDDCFTPTEEAAMEVEHQLFSGDWFEWKPSGAPVGPNTFVDVLYRDGTTNLCIAAGGLGWRKNDDYLDIVAYRIVRGPVTTEPAHLIREAYIEGFINATENNETIARIYAEKNWPNSQASAHADAVSNSTPAETGGKSP